MTERRRQGPFSSLNEETGMLEDIEEVRELALSVAKLALGLLLLPSTTLSYTPPAIADLGTFLVQVRALLEYTTQYAFFEAVGYFYGMRSSDIEFMAKEYHLSREYPTTHPQAQGAWEYVPETNPDGPLLNSPLLWGAHQEHQQKPGTHVAEHLPDAIEAFLKEVLQQKEGERHDTTD